MPRATTFRTWDDYFIPGTSVLRNKFTAPGKPYGETDPDKLRTLEEAYAHSRVQELAETPIEGRFDYDHMKAIHGHIFQDVYEWAGQERVAPVGQFMTKDGHAYYGAGPHLTAAAEAEYAKLASKNYLRGLEPAEFVDQLAESWGEVNVIHSFREGNTRTQFVFFSQLAQQAGYRIDPAHFPQARAEGTYLAPAILTNVDHTMPVMNEECFGPVVGIMPVASDAEAVALMNDSNYGLTASVFTRDLNAARALGRQIQTGTFFMNRCDYLDPALAWTGVKNTGHGISLSILGYHALTRVKSYHLRLL